MNQQLDLFLTQQTAIFAHLMAEQLTAIEAGDPTPHRSHYLLAQFAKTQRLSTLLGTSGTDRAFVRAVTKAIEIDKRIDIDNWHNNYFDATDHGWDWARQNEYERSILARQWGEYPISSTATPGGVSRHHRIERCGTGGAGGTTGDGQ